MDDCKQVSGKVISQKECQKYQQGEYKVKAIVPSCTAPYVTEYIIKGEDIAEALKDWFGIEVGEFVVGVARVEEKI